MMRSLSLIVVLFGVVLLVALVVALVLASRRGPSAAPAHLSRAEDAESAARPEDAASAAAGPSAAAGVIPAPEPVPVPAPEPVPQPGPDPEPVPQPGPDPEPVPKPEPVPAPQPEPFPRPEPGPAPEPFPEQPATQGPGEEHGLGYWTTPAGDPAEEERSRRIATAADWRDTTSDPDPDPVAPATERRSQVWDEAPPGMDEVMTETERVELSEDVESPRNEWGGPHEDEVEQPTAGSATTIIADTEEYAATEPLTAAESTPPVEPTTTTEPATTTEPTTTTEPATTPEPAAPADTGASTDLGADADTADTPDVLESPSAGRRVSGLEEVRDGGYGMGSAAPLEDGGRPLDHPVQGYTDTMTFRAPGDEGYDAREPDVWFYDEGAAERAGFHRSGS